MPIYCSVAAPFSTNDNEIKSITVNNQEFIITSETSTLTVENNVKLQINQIIFIIYWIGTIGIIKNIECGIFAHRNILNQQINL